MVRLAGRLSWPVVVTSKRPGSGGMDRQADDASAVRLAVANTSFPFHAQTCAPARGEPPRLTVTSRFCAPVAIVVRGRDRELAGRIGQMSMPGRRAG